MSRRAFTLIELMIVISIIAALGAMSVPAISFAKKIVRQNKCHALIAQVKAGLESYRTSYGSYPEGPPNVNPPDLKRFPSWDSSDVFKSGTSYKTAEEMSPIAQLDDPIYEKYWQNVNRALLIHLSTINGDNFQTTSGEYINDPFNPGSTQRVLRYRPARFYPFDDTKTQVIDKDDPPGRDSYQLWSCGSNGIDEYGAKAGDDITSWEKR